VDRVFEEIAMFRPEGGGQQQGEMDYKSFLDFVLAMENKRTPQGLAYLFRLLDVRGDGYLDSFTITYFFRDIVQILLDNGIEAAKMEDVTDEIFDMVKPTDPSRITLKDLLRSGCGGTVVDMLVDINGFWAYDNRESLVDWDEDEDGGGAEQPEGETGDAEQTDHGEDLIGEAEAMLGM
jgi:hypothetical protein